MSKTALIFPGQGSQFVGMGKDLYQQCQAAQKVFDQAGQILGFDLAKVCFEGPAEKLNATDVQQPAIFTHSVAVLEAIKASAGPMIEPSYAAGLSLGEYTAYYAAGSLDFASALKLVHQRGRFMQQAAEQNPGSMVSVMGLSDEQVMQLCQQAAGGQVLVAANFNCPGQVVISGERPACERAVRLAEEMGAARVVPLDVAGAFHSPLMQPAADKLLQVLHSVHFKPPSLPVITNVDCNSYADADQIVDSLYRQVTAATYWCRSMRKLCDNGVTQFYELGPKRVLSSFMRRINRSARVTSVGTADELAKLLDAVAAE